MKEITDFDPKKLNIYFWEYPLIDLTDSNAEQIITHKLQSLGYTVFRGLDVAKNKTIIKFSGKAKEAFDDISGLPDLFCFKINDDGKPQCFFVEVKSLTDGVRITQLRWYKKHREIPIMIICPNDEFWSRMIIPEPKNISPENISLDSNSGKQ